MEEELLGTAELSAMVGLGTATLRRYLYRGPPAIPGPDFRYRGHPLWRKETVVQWLAERRPVPEIMLERPIVTKLLLGLAESEARRSLDGGYLPGKTFHPGDNVGSVVYALWGIDPYLVSSYFADFLHAQHRLAEGNGSPRVRLSDVVAGLRLALPPQCDDVVSELLERRVASETPQILGYNPG